MEAFLMRNKVATGYMLGMLAMLITLTYFLLVEMEHAEAD